MVQSPPPMTISLSQGISKICFDRGRLQGVMGNKYSKLSLCIMAYCDTLQVTGQAPKQGVPRCRGNVLGDPSSDPPS